MCICAQGMRVRSDGPQLISQMIAKYLNIDCSVLMGANIAGGAAVLFFLILGFTRGRIPIGWPHSAIGQHILQRAHGRKHRRWGSRAMGRSGRVCACCTLWDKGPHCITVLRVAQVTLVVSS